MEIVLHHDKDIDLNDIQAVSDQQAVVLLHPDTEAMLRQRRREIEQFVNDQNMPAYGFNRGFGHNVDTAVDSDQLEVLQENLILSHAVGMGEAAPRHIVRVIMFLRAQSLSRGFSGIRAELVLHILDMLNHDILPVVPELGSVGASGDLAPLSHIALGMLGKGRVHFQGKEMDASIVLNEVGIEPLKLQMKEGLALTNGVQFMNAYGLYAVSKLKMLLKNASINTALTAQVMLAPETPFREDLHQVRPHPGAIQVSSWITDLMADSPLREAHREYCIDGEIQDPYNIRCAGQVLGSCAELINESEDAFLREANSVTDNPVILPAKEEYGWNTKERKKYLGKHVDIVSGGHFHGMPVAIRVYNLFQVMAMMASLTNQRCVRYVDNRRNKGLGRDLKWPGLSRGEASISSGMMMPEYVTAALTNSIWGAAMPSHLFNISTNTGQEDHVSMGSSLAVRLYKTLPQLADLMAIEMAYIHQASAIRKELPYIPSKLPVDEVSKNKVHEMLKEFGDQEEHFELDIELNEHYLIDPEQRKLNQVGEAVLNCVGRLFPVVKKDRYISENLRALSLEIYSGKFVKVAAQFVVMN